MLFNTMYFVQIIVVTVFFGVTKANYCGCRSMRPCYKRMLDALLLEDEEPCVENVAVGASTVTIFLNAIKTYCGNTVKVYSNSTTFERKNLYEVVINGTRRNRNEEDPRPVIVLEAGQDAGIESVAFALYVIEQLVACSENREMIQNVRWVILPSSNPDGLEYLRNHREPWYKNLNYRNDSSHGVDITRNFDESWDVCFNTNSIASQKYAGLAANSEKETIFISNVLSKHKNNIKTYISFRRDGHGILYPFAARNLTFESLEKVKKLADDIAAKVNYRAGGLQWFVSDSIFNMNGEAHCGHSVDYAINRLGIPNSFEMRLFSEADNDIMARFQALPKGHEISLRAGYFSGIRQLYKSIVKETKQNKQSN